MKTNIRVFFSLSLLLLGAHVVAQQTVASGDTLTASSPIIDYAIPTGDLTIANIAIVGSETYEDYVLIGFSGLSVGQKIKVPGTEISGAVKRFWKQGLFSDVKVFATKIEDGKIWLNIKLKQRPQVSKINYNGPDVFKPLSPWAYFGLSILFSLPVVGFIFLIIFSVSDANINRRNFARSYWCIYVIIAVAAVVAVASGVTLGSLENIMAAVRPIA